MDNKKWIHVLSIDKAVKGYLEFELRLLFGDIIKLTSSTVTDVISEDIRPTVVITSGYFLENDAKKLFPDSLILSARRDISFNNLEKVISLPRNKKVLVVNHPTGASITTIDSLVSMGFNHLEYIPYCIGADIDFSDIDTAISPAMMHLCPEEIKNKIDIGPRTISFSTLSILLKTFGLDESYLDNYLYQYNRGLTSMSLKLSESLQVSEAIRSNFNLILDEIDDGIISIDEDKNIIYVNSASVKLLNLMDVDSIKGKNIQSILKSFKGHSDIFKDLMENKSGVYSINNKEIILTYVQFQSKAAENSMLIMKKVDELQKLEEDVRRILQKKGYTAKYSFKDIIGNSKDMNKTISIAKRISKSESTVIITGESGTGKEVFAQAIHNNSKRAKESFVAVNLASLPESLVESELFGYSEGAFTGARKGGRAGLFEQAHKGTIFIDEIGDISPTTQARLLRVLQEKEVMKIGDNKIISVDIRFIAATNKDLKKLVDEGKFREDLYYRLNILPLHLPPLRERKEDIELFIDYLLKNKQTDKKISKEVIDIMFSYNWPGNVRELINVIEYITEISQEEIVIIDDLPRYLMNSMSEDLNNTELDNSKQIDLYLNKLETKFILQTLQYYQEQNIRIGRKKISELSMKENIPNMTEDKIRTILSKLDENGLVIIGKTKQGTMITEKGIKYLGRLGVN